MTGSPAAQGVTVETERLILRPWRSTDLVPFAELNADPEVLRHFVSPLNRAQSGAFVSERIQPHFDRHGYGPWAAERKDTKQFIGFVGLMWQDFPAAFTPALEVGWRLARAHWGHGFATEAAERSLQFAFNSASQTQVVSMTAVGNARSIAVMERLGMTRNADEDFDHPRVPVGHPLRRHVLFRITDQQWLARHTQAEVKP